MPRKTGPTIARWQLGRQLRALREQAGLTHPQIAEELGCTEWKIYKIESGTNGVQRSDLVVMLERYGVTDEAVREPMFALQREGKQRGWWVKYGKVSDAYSMYIGLESFASQVRNYELAVVPGLLQTDAYARALLTASPLGGDPAEVDRRVRLRLERQFCLTDEPRLRFSAVLDEGVLHRQFGGPTVLKEQLEHLVQMSKLPNITIRVARFADAERHIAMSGMSLMDFPDGMRPPIVYVESYAGDTYLEKNDDIKQAVANYTRLSDTALTATKSRELIASIAKQLA